MPESLIQKFPTQIHGNFISSTKEVKNIGVTFDSGNTFASIHITKVCCTCYYHLKDLRHAHAEIPQCADYSMPANWMISSQIDYCNPYSMIWINIMWLDSKRFKMRFALSLDWIEPWYNPYLQKVHWLPISYCIFLKYNLITFKAITFSELTYF